MDEYELDKEDDVVNDDNDEVVVERVTMPTTSNSASPPFIHNTEPNEADVHHDGNNNNNNNISSPTLAANTNGMTTTDESPHNINIRHDAPCPPPNAYTSASFFSKLFFTWPYPLLKLGMQQTLQLEQLPQNSHPDTSQYALQHFTRIWNQEQQRCLRDDADDDDDNNDSSNSRSRRKHHSSSSSSTRKRRKRPNLRYAMAKDYFVSLWYIQPMMGIGATAKVVQAYTLGQLIDYFARTDGSSTSSSTNSDGYRYASIIVLCGIIILLEHHHLFFYTWKKGMQLRISCIAAIYQKCTTLSSLPQPPPLSSSSSSSSKLPTTTTTTKSLSSASYGQVMNLVSNDVERFLLAALFVNYIFWGPITGIAIVMVGYYLLGYSFVIGFVILLVFFIPLQIYFSRRFAHYRNRIAQHTDQRVSQVGQAIRGVRMMKLLGYEPHFLSTILQYRNQEIAQICHANRLKAYNEAFIFMTNIIISVIIFIVHVTVFHKPLRQGEVFTVFALINILQMELTKHVSLGIMGVSELYVSLGRIQRFLESPELLIPDHHESNNHSISDETIKTEPALKSYNDDVAIALDHVTCYWNHTHVHVVPPSPPPTTTTATTIKGTTAASETDSAVSTTDSVAVVATSSTLLSTTNTAAALRDITVPFHFGTITAVIGTVGCGKSALLQTIVNELPLSFGTLYRKKHTTLAYAAQDPWIMDGTIRENILLGEVYDKTWYNEVISACALLIDIEHFIHGDMTIVGDRGVQCSGGQRARIGLARAIYRRADILVVDDPLSAVDTKVGRQLYDQALLQLNVHRGKCVILATHQHQYVHDWTCVLMNHGTIQCIGTYDECVAASKGKLTTKSNSHSNLRSHSMTGTDTTEQLSNTDNAIDIGMGAAKLEDNPTLLSNTSTTETIPTALQLDNTESFQEMNHVGTLASGTYYSYIKAMGGLWVGIALFFLFTITQGSVLLTIVVIGRWSKRPTYAEQMDWSVIGLIIGLSIIVMILAIFRALVSFSCTILASQNLHNQMTKAILRTKIQFFDTNPLGRILNRFSADIGIMDDQLPPTLFDFFTLAFVVIGAVATTVTTLPFVLLVLPFLIWYFLSVRRVFITSTRELKRLEGLARSPIFAMISESLNGIATIRSNNALDYFRKKFQTVHDTHTRCFFAFIAASRWVGFRMDSLVTILLTMSCYLSVLFHDQGWFNVDPAVLGLSLSMLLQLAGLFQWCVRQSAEVVNQMVSVERVLAFGNVESEAPLVMDGDDALLASGWPNEGNIQLQDVSVRYRSTLPFALHNVNMEIEAGTRVGIVGRSGSGKSTFMQTLFRLLETEGNGKIFIDNVDVSKIGLHTLRRKISVIPQVPTLFSNCTIRDNLDLLHQYTDEEIEKVIIDCHLGDLISELPHGYYTMVMDGSFSTGQRQLLCLARALLCRNTILILDEATANVDQHTDQILQQTLLRHDRHTDAGDDEDGAISQQRTNKSNGTMIAIAHRLDTVIDYDTIFVFGNGTVLESGSPYELLLPLSGVVVGDDDVWDGSDPTTTAATATPTIPTTTTTGVPGTFRSMVHDTGDIMSQELYRRAKVYHDHVVQKKNL